MTPSRDALPSLRERIVRGGLGSLVVKVANAAIAFALAIVLARSLGPDGYGVYSYAIALATLLAIPAQLGLPTLLVREVAKYEAREAWSPLRGVLRWSLRAGLGVSLGLAGCAALVAWMLGDRLPPDQLRTVGLALLLLPLLAAGGLLSAALRGFQRVVLGQLAESVVRPGLLLAACAALFVAAPAMRRADVAMAVHLAAAAVAVVLAAWWFRGSVPASVRASDPTFETRRWLRSVGPLALIAGATIINSQTDLLMLAWFRPAAEVGHYRVAVQGAMLVIFGLQAVNMVVAPQFARLHATGDHARLQRVVTGSARAVTVLALPVALGLIVYGDVFLGLAFGAAYTVAHGALAVLAAGQLLSALIGSVGPLLNMSGHERATARGFAISAVANVVLNLALIPRFGIVGAAVATALSLSVWNVLLYRAVRTKLDIHTTALGAGRQRG